MPSSLRDRLGESLKMAIKAQEPRAKATLRLALAALKDRDIAARTKDRSSTGIDEAEILTMLQTMIKQRRESITFYEKGGRLELVKQEAEEIEIIEGFMPEQMSAAATKKAVAGVIREVGAKSVKDMGAVMAALRERHAGEMDFAKASGLVKEKLA